MRTERDAVKRRREEKWQTCWCYRDRQRACIMAQASAEKLEHTGPTETRKSGLGATKRAVGKFTRAAFAKSKKKQSSQSKAPDREGERVQVSESRTLASEREIRASAWRGKSGLHSKGRQIP